MLSRALSAFVRSLPSASTAGGIARRTREAMVRCEAAGFDVVIVETVGVGQGEVAVADMVDTLVAVLIAGAGDDLQGIKKGMLEQVDVVAINKADGDGMVRARLAARELSAAMHFQCARASGFAPRALAVSAQEGSDIEELLLAGIVHLPIFPTVDMTRSSGAFSDGDRIAWGMGFTQLDQVFRWSVSWRGHRQLVFALIAILDPLPALSLAAGGATLLGRLARRPPLARLAPIAPLAALGGVGASAFVALAALVIAAVEATKSGSGPGVVGEIGLVVTAIASVGVVALALPSGFRWTRRALHVVLSVPFAACGVAALSSLFESASRAGAPGVALLVTALALGPSGFALARPPAACPPRRGCRSRAASSTSHPGAADRRRATQGLGGRWETSRATR